MDSKERKKREPILRCPKCGVPLFGSEKTPEGYKIRIKKIQFKKPYFFNIPTQGEFELECSCGKTSQVNLRSPASISFLINYLRKVKYHMEKQERNRKKK